MEFNNRKINTLWNVLLILAVLKAVWRIGIMNSIMLVVGLTLIKWILVPFVKELVRSK